MKTVPRPRDCSGVERAVGEAPGLNELRMELPDHRLDRLDRLLVGGRNIGRAGEDGFGQREGCAIRRCREGSRASRSASKMPRDVRAGGPGMVGCCGFVSLYKRGFLKWLQRDRPR
jgi:hypothetical protein